MKSLIFLILCLFIGLSSFAQMADSFDDGELFNNPSWSGDVSDFNVIDGILKLNAEDAGNSKIYTALTFPDTLFWDLELTMDFAPSKSNQLIIILASKSNTELEDVYYLQIGESGSNDAFEFYKNDTNGKVLLGRASDGAMANEPAIAALHITYDKEQMWTINVSYNNSPFEEEIVVFDPDFHATEYAFFGISCDYTKSRIDKFYFDNFVIDTLRPDETAPVFLHANAIMEHQIKLEFSESISSISANDLSNYNLSGGVDIQSILWDASSAKTIYLITDQPLASGEIYTLNIEGLSDEVGNIITPVTTEISLVEIAQKGDLIINEVLFNPVTNGDDFIEIYNRSSKTIQLDSLRLYNSTNDRVSIIRTSRVLKKGQYMAFTSDKNTLINQYPKNDAKQIIQQSIPTMNNESGNMGIYTYENGIRTMIDSFDYDESFHFAFLDDLNGVSLERIDPNGNTNDKNNWHSAASNFNYASPGLKNSVNIPTLMPTEELFTVITPIFSPDGDGFDDIMLLQYNLGGNDYIVNASIYNSRGVLITDLVQNKSLSAEGYLSWDGSYNSGQIGEIGIYVLHIDYYTEAQTKESINKSFVLGKKL